MFQSSFVGLQILEAVNQNALSGKHKREIHTNRQKEQLKSQCRLINMRRMIMEGCVFYLILSK
jgi:hypothetical protein